MILVLFWSKWNHLHYPDLPFLYCPPGICVKIPHHCTISARIHLQKVQAPVGDGRSGPRSVARRPSHSDSLNTSLTTTCPSHSSPSSPAFCHAFWQSRGERGQANFPSVWLPQPGEDPRVWGEDYHMGDHVLQSSRRLELLGLVNMKFQICLMSQTSPYRHDGYSIWLCHSRNVTRSIFTALWVLNIFV